VPSNEIEAVQLPYIRQLLIKSGDYEIGHQIAVQIPDGLPPARVPLSWNTFTIRAFSPNWRDINVAKEQGKASPRKVRYHFFHHMISSLAQHEKAGIWQYRKCPQEAVGKQENKKKKEQSAQSVSPNAS
jgi:hypothetical protein